MKEIQEYTTRYIADDGTVFNSRAACEQYESEKEKDKYRKELFKHRVVLPDPIVPVSHHPNADFIWYKVDSDYVYNLISLAYDKRDLNIELKKSKYLCIEINHRGEIVNTFTIEETIEYVKDYLRKLEAYGG